MNCRHVERLLSNQQEGRLSWREAGAVAAHLHDCRSCRRFQDDWAAMEAELRAYADPLPPPGIERRAVALWIAQREARVWSPRRGFLIPLPRLSSVRRSPLHTAVLMAILLLAVLGLELPASGYRVSGPVLLSQGPGAPGLAHQGKV